MPPRLNPVGLRPIPFALVAGLLLHRATANGGPGSGTRAEALAQAMKTHGLEVSPGGVAFLPDTASNGLRGRSVKALVRASSHDDPPALFLVDTRLSPEGLLLDAGAPHKLTRSKGVEESSPAVSRTHVATALVDAGQVLSVHLVDLGGEPRPEGPHWTALARTQNALTNLQETGQFAGIGRRSFKLVPPTANVTLRFDGDNLVVNSDGREARIPQRLAAGQPEVREPWLEPEAFEKGQVGNVVTWAVDRVRAMSWFGDDNMQRLKAVAFGALDVATQAKSKVTTDDTQTEIQQDLGDMAGSNTVSTFTDPETGWPPPKLEPYLKKPIPGEGEWMTLDHDPFVQVGAGAPPAFATTFIRTDKERPYTRIYITIWDPRQVSLHPVGGTVEPASATGSTGSGLIPRTPKVMKRVVAAFNGGFQAMHGEFGMMADSVVYLPPKPFAATVAELRDGSTAFGVWPNNPDIPPNIVGYRQNLTPMVLDQKWNPYGRTWWGGTPPGWPDRVHTTRSGLCMTAEGFVGYFYGNGIDADVLGLAMIQARCKVGMHLDMNPGHTGLEFYRLAPKEGWQPLGRAYQADWETEGEISQINGWRFRARRMVRGMGLMNFPRYIQREARDYFYLTLRPILPGADLTQGAAGGDQTEGKWRVKGLAQHGYPYALATTVVRPDKAKPDAKVRLLKVDPKAVMLAGAPVEAKVAGQEVGQPVLTLQGAEPAKSGQVALFHGPSGFVIGKEGGPGATALLGGSTSSQGAQTALGVDDDGMLVFAEGEGGAQVDGATLEQALKALGCEARLFVDKPLTALQGGTTTLSGAAASKRGGHEVKLVRAAAPSGRFIYEDTPIVPMSEWSPLQLKRIRYFKHNNQ